MPKKKKTKIASPIRSLRSIEIFYQREVNRFGRKMTQAVREEVLEYLKNQEPNYAADSLSDRLRLIFERLNGLFAGTISASFSKITAEQMVEKVGTANRNKFVRSVSKAVGVDLGNVIQSEGLEDFISLSVSRNVSLIKTLPEQYFSQIETIVTNGVASGAKYTTIQKEILGKTGVNSKLFKRIGVIARNEVQTINSQITLKRSEALGIKEGIYRTSEDERVRKCHKELNGMMYPLNKGAWSKTCQKFIQPGITDINCRCTYSPVIEVEG